MPQSNSREQGSALLYVFIGLILFTGLVFTFSKSFQNSNDLSSPQQGKIAANDILSYTTDISQTVTKLITKGCSENDISFENPIVTGYTNPGAPVDKHCNVFAPEGGMMSWMKQPIGSNDGSDWIITDTSTETFDGTTAQLGTANAELILLLPFITNDVCDSINSQLGNPAVWESNGSHNLIKFTGTFETNAATTLNRGNLTPLISSGCFCDTAGVCTAASPRWFFSTLIVR